MANLIINGGKTLSGTITPSGNKNSVLPILCATLLIDGKVTLNNVPDIIDVNKLYDTLTSIGSKIEWDKENCRMVIDNTNINHGMFDNEFPLDMRGSLLLLAPLLYQMKKLKMCNSVGGCALGIREIDPHLDLLEALGTKIERKKILELSIDGRFKAGKVWPDFMGVTSTENFIMASVLAEGVSTITNAASEPHVQDLCNFLVKAGAKIKGIGTSTLEITGVEKLSGPVEYRVLADHHEIATFLALGAMTNGEIHVNDAIPEHMPLVVSTFKKLGVKIEYEGNVAIVRPNQSLQIEAPFTANMLPRIEAAPWPYFPVDVLPLMMALSVRSTGNIMFWNKVYEGAFNWIQELMKFGAHVVACDPHRVIVFGGKKLSPAEVNAPNIIRATIGLAMVGLSVEGRSVVKNADTIKRAHPNFVENLASLGADISWE